MRGFQDGSDPQRTERQLRAARALSDARREGRVFEGLCVDLSDGFRVHEALALYGGMDAVECACRACAANALAQTEAGALAGCYGIVALPDEPTAVHEAVERSISRAYPDANWSDLCVATTPRWYGLWMDSPFKADQLLVRFRVLEAATIEYDVTAEEIRQLMAGLKVALKTGCRVHVALFPSGRVEGTEWKLMTHCPRCKAAWGNLRSRHCQVCDYDGPPAPDVKRKARGRRPYFALERVLGKEAAAAFLIRYEAFRARQRLRDQA